MAMQQNKLVRIGFNCTPRMTHENSKTYIIKGITKEGKTFRPSDWSERLAGVMSQFRPGGAQSGRQLSYSPWCVPRVFGDVRCVVVKSDIRSLEPMAWDFVMNFAKDNHLTVIELTDSDLHELQNSDNFKK